ncbi:hypothetical protein HFO06_23945 [Rhizobium leguminosarum]|uniref:hypothetical protein n=1 Tax=Rhizobium leguminosarum TaxID=384 RepID=UPI001C985C70|nr:hypothetical protein [Rhizobium leguminosarum]MBY5766125.1 hypothetical protein [Rhizobium leguminosarum]
MNALNAQGNMAGRLGGDGHTARAATAMRPRGDRHSASAATGILPARRQAFCQRGMIGFAALFHTLSSS